jgi:hypothetical protein
MANKDALERAEQWMRRHKGLLPGPLTDPDFDQLRDLLAEYAGAVPSQAAGLTEQPRNAASSSVREKIAPVCTRRG